MVDGERLRMMIQMSESNDCCLREKTNLVFERSKFVHLRSRNSIVEVSFRVVKYRNLESALSRS